MDTEDVSGFEQFMGMLAKQKAALEKADKRKREQPRDRKTLNHLSARHMINYAGKALMKAQNELTIHQSFVAPPYLPSVAPFKKLNKVYLKDLRLQIHHRVMAIMEDEMGEGVTLQLYQQEDQHNRPAEDIIEIKRSYIIREPYYKVMNDGGYGVRIDHVSDIICLSAGDKRIPLDWRPKLEEVKEATVLKQEGNEAIKCGRTHAAVELYTQALSLTSADEVSRIITLNRSLAHLKLGLYDKAIEDAGALDNHAQRSEKSLYRAASAMSGLRRFKECHETLKILLADYPDCKSAKREMTRMERLLREEERGEYDYKLMYEAAQKTPPCLDNGTYIGPLAIQDSNGRGRGLFTTRDVAAGELLLCEKAFAHCFAAHEAGEDSAKVMSRTALLMNTHNNRAYMGAQADLITVIVSKLRKNPSLMPIYQSLYHGDYVPVEETCVDDMPIVDTFLVERIISLNVFGCPRTSLQAHFDKKQKCDNYHTCGIFITASYINHSCHGNARRSFIGDVQIIRAAGSISAGTEITFSYVNLESTDTHDKIQARLANWGFRCTCITCSEIKKTKKSILDKRLALCENLRATFVDKNGVDISKAERLLAALEKTYTGPATAFPRLTSSAPYLGLARLYTQNNKPAHATTYAWRVLTSLGFVIKREQPASLTSVFEIDKWGYVVADVIETWIHLWVAYAKLAPTLCAKCEEYARMSYKICIGEDETFDEHYGTVAKKAIYEDTNMCQEMEKMKI